MNPVRYKLESLDINPNYIGKKAYRVVANLQENGFDGYLVGGCVRDLLLGRCPKDFDIATNASPEQVRSIFPRSRIIGRRFKIVHVRFGREVIEVTTYRADPGKHDNDNRHLTESGRILRDNVYGTLEQDALRRDFTINALYCDPVKGEVLDFLNGIQDVEQRKLTIIGNAENRFTEDPVRILRVLRFNAKLDLVIGADIISAMEKYAGMLLEVPTARLFDEVIKLFHHGHALESWQEIKRYNLVKLLFPQTSELLDSNRHPRFEEMIVYALENTDLRISQNKPVIASFFFAVLLWAPFKIERDKLLERGLHVIDADKLAGETVFKRSNQRVATPRRVSMPSIEMWEMQAMLEHRRPKHINRILGSRRFRAAYDLMLLRGKIGEVSNEFTEWWTRIQEVDQHAAQQMIDKLPGYPKQKRNEKSQKIKKKAKKKSGRRNRHVYARNNHHA